MKEFLAKLRFYLRNPSALWHGEFSYERFDRQRAQYARDNPWVLNYDFGHKELLEYENYYDSRVI